MRRKAAAVLAGGLVLGVGSASTLAAWTDREQSQATFKSGIFKLESSVNGVTFADHTSNTATLAFDGGRMFPGSLQYAFLDVKTTDISSMDGTATLLKGEVTEDFDGLEQHLTLRVAVISQSKDCNSGNLNEVASATQDIGDAPPSQSVGKSLIKLGGNTVRFCFEVGMEADTPTTMQGKSAKVTLTVSGESIPDA